MTNKCKICGYVFKDKDEVICPECLTARDDDISCDNYSRDLHDHNRFSYRDNNQSSFFDRDDTYDDDNSFIENEKKSERKDKFANQAQQQATGYSNAFSAFKSSADFSKAASVFKTFNASNSTSKPSDKSKPKKRSKLISILLCIIIVSMVYRYIFSIINKNNFNDIKNSIMSSSSYDDNDYDFGDDYRLKTYSDYKESEVLQSKDLNSVQKKTILNNFSGVSSWKTLTSTIVITPDDEKDESYTVTSVECSALDSNQQTISKTKGTSIDKTITKESNKTNITCNYSLLYPSEATKLKVIVTVSKAGEKTKHDFQIYL